MYDYIWHEIFHHDVFRSSDSYLQLFVVICSYHFDVRNSIFDWIHMEYDINLIYNIIHDTIIAKTMNDICIPL